MKKAIIVAALFGSVLLVAAKDTTAANAENARYKAELDAGIAKLNAVHIARLTVIQNELTKAGDLDGAVAIRDQIAAIKAVPNQPDSVASSPVSPAPQSTTSAKNESSDVSFLKGDWFLLSGGNRHKFVFDDKGNFQSVPWGSGTVQSDGKRVIFPKGAFAKIVDANTLVRDNGEKFVRKTDDTASPTGGPDHVNPFGRP